MLEIENIFMLCCRMCRFSFDKQMKFGLDKCKIRCIEKERCTDHTEFEVGKGQGMIAPMREDGQCKYLGYMQAGGSDYKAAKERTSHTYATPTLAYSFGVIGWTDTELNNLNIAT